VLARVPDCLERRVSLSWPECAVYHAEATQEEVTWETLSPTNSVAQGQVTLPTSQPQKDPEAASVERCRQAGRTGSREAGRQEGREGGRKEGRETAAIYNEERGQGQSGTGMGKTGMGKPRLFRGISWLGRSIGKISKVPFIVTFYSVCNRALTSQKVFKVANRPTRLSLPLLPTPNRRNCRNRPKRPGAVIGTYV